LGTTADNQSAGNPLSVIGGSSTSVAVIESTATAAAKWWSAGLGTAVLAVWGGIRSFWVSSESSLHAPILYGAAFVTAAALLGITYLLSSDVRARSMAASATIEARARVALGVLHASTATTSPSGTGVTEDGTIVVLGDHDVTYAAAGGAGQGGWKALAARFSADKVDYLVVRGAQTVWAASDQVTFT
jgi:hypothetical protein